MGVTFRYDIVGSCAFGTIYRPIAKISFQSPKNSLWTDVWAVVDTGADFTILPRYVSNDLAISIEHECTKDVTRGVGGDQTIFLLKSPIKAKIGKMERNIPLAFFDTNEIPALLGRLGFLETFDTEFLKNHTVIFKE